MTRAQFDRYARFAVRQVPSAVTYYPNEDALAYSEGFSSDDGGALWWRRLLVWSEGGQLRLGQDVRASTAGARLELSYVPGEEGMAALLTWEDSIGESFFDDLNLGLLAGAQENAP